MSYIRCLSNPEGLYIVGTMHGRIEIMHSVKPPLSSKWPRQRGCRLVGKGENNRIVPTNKFYDATPIIVVPYKAFMDTCRAWADYVPDKGTSRRGLRVREVHVYTDTGKPVPKNWGAKMMLKNRRPTAFLIRLSYGRQFVHLWKVTWMYVVRNATADFRKPKRKKHARR